MHKLTCFIHTERNFRSCQSNEGSTFEEENPKEKRNELSFTNQAHGVCLKPYNALFSLQTFDSFSLGFGIKVLFFCNYSLGNVLLSWKPSL